MCQGIYAHLMFIVTSVKVIYYSHFTQDEAEALVKLSNSPKITQLG